MIAVSRGVRAAFLAMLIAVAGGCSSPERTAWQEEVKLSDGRVIRVDRQITWITNQPLGQGKNYITSATVLKPAVDPPGFAFPAWRGDAEAVLLFDIDAANGSLFLVTYADTCQRYVSGGEPDPPYFEYRVRGDRWELVPFDAALVGRNANMYLDPRVPGERALVDLEYKSESFRWYLPQARALVAHGRRSNC